MKKWLRTLMTQHHVSRFEIAMLFVAIPLMFFWMAMALTFRSWLTQTSGIWTSGTVVAVTSCTSNSVSLHIQFTDAHGVRHIAQSDCVVSHVPLGHAIQVLYVPRNPQAILIPSQMDPNRGKELITWVVLSAVSLMVFLIVARCQVVTVRHQRRQRLLQQAVTGE